MSVDRKQLTELDTIAAALAGLNDKAAEEIKVRAVEAFTRTHPGLGAPKEVAAQASEYIDHRMREMAQQAYVPAPVERSLGGADSPGFKSALDQAFVPDADRKALGEPIAAATAQASGQDYKTPLTVQLYSTEVGKVQASVGMGVDANGIAGGALNAQTGVWKQEGGVAQVTAAGSIGMDGHGNISGGTVGLKGTTDVLGKLDGNTMVGIAGVSTSIPAEGGYDFAKNTSAYAGAVALNGKNAVIATASSNLEGGGLNLQLSEHYTVLSDPNRKLQAELNGGVDYAPLDGNVSVGVGAIVRKDNMFVQASVAARNVNRDPEWQANVSAGVEL